MPNYELPIVVRTLSGDDVDRHMRMADKGSSDPAPQLTDADLMLTSPIVYGFSLADKLWREQHPAHSICRRDANGSVLLSPPFMIRSNAE